MNYAIKTPAGLTEREAYIWRAGWVAGHEGRDGLPCIEWCGDFECERIYLCKKIDEVNFQVPAGDAAPANGAVREALEALTSMCEVHGDFSNGVTDSTGTIDEGVVRAGEIIRAARAALAAHTPSTASDAVPMSCSHSHRSYCAMFDASGERPAMRLLRDPEALAAEDAAGGAT